MKVNSHSKLPDLQKAGIADRDHFKVQQSKSHSGYGGPTFTGPQPTNEPPPSLDKETSNELLYKEQTQLHKTEVPLNLQDAMAEGVEKTAAPSEIPVPPQRPRGVTATRAAIASTSTTATTTTTTTVTRARASATDSQVSFDRPRASSVGIPQTDFDSNINILPEVKMAMKTSWATIDAYLLRLDDESSLVTFLTGPDAFATKEKFDEAAKELSNCFKYLKDFNVANKGKAPAGPSRVEGPRSLVAVEQARIRVAQALLTVTERSIEAHESGAAPLTKEQLDRAVRKKEGFPHLIAMHEHVIADIQRQAGTLKKPGTATANHPVSSGQPQPQPLPHSAQKRD
ncbi:MAG: hypothetical protein Q7T87_22100 [Polaromonas sp.]|nr:hypothetical protein [Polaromonas sp.]